MHRTRKNPAALPAHVVDAIIKQYRNGLSAVEIAQLLNVSERSVYSYLDQAAISREKLERITEDELKTIAKLYTSGWGAYEIANSTGRSAHAIYDALKILGLKERERKQGTGIDRFTEEQIGHIREMWTAGLSAAEVGEYLGESSTYAYTILKQAGVDTSAKRISDKEKALAVNLYNEGLTSKKIGEKLGISQGSVMNILRQFSVPIRVAAPPRLLTDDQVLEVSYLREGGASMAEIAKQLGVSKTTLRTAMIRAGLYVSKGKASNKEKDEVKTRYEAGESIASIAKDFEVEPSVIRAALEGMGVAIDPVRGNPCRGRRF